MRIIILVIFLLIPFSLFGNYDPNRIKNELSKQDTLFTIQGWQATQSPNSWKAITSHKLIFVTVDEKTTKVKSPHINPIHKREASIRCEQLGFIGIQPSTKEEEKKIKYVVRMATQKHVPQYTDINNVRFEVLPEMKTTHVSLICRLRPSK